MSDTTARGTECASTETEGLGPQGERPGPKDAPKTEGASAPAEPQAWPHIALDAARYRWLRGLHNTWAMRCLSGEVLDAAIDAARSTAALKEQG